MRYIRAAPWMMYFGAVAKCSQTDRDISTIIWSWAKNRVCAETELHSQYTESFAFKRPPASYIQAKSTYICMFHVGARIYASMLGPLQYSHARRPHLRMTGVAYTIDRVSQMGGDIDDIQGVP